MKNCPFCGGETWVQDSRTIKGGFIRRRRRCKNCDDSFSTVEVPMEAAIVLAHMVSHYEDLKGLLALATHVRMPYYGTRKNENPAESGENDEFGPKSGESAPNPPSHDVD